MFCQTRSSTGERAPREVLLDESRDGLNLSKPIDDRPVVFLSGEILSAVLHEEQFVADHIDALQISAALDADHVLPANAW